MYTRRQWALLIGAAILAMIYYVYSEKQDKDYSAEEKISTAEVFFDIASAEDKLIEVEMDIEYSRYGDISKHFVLSTDEAGDRASGTILIAYRAAASEIPFSVLVTKKGRKLLDKKSWEVIESLSNSLHEPVRISDVNIKNMTPDPDPESVGRPMFFLNEKSGDAIAGI